MMGMSIFNGGPVHGHRIKETVENKYPFVSLCDSTYRLTYDGGRRMCNLSFVV